MHWPLACFRVDLTGTQWSTNQDSKTRLLWASENKDPPSWEASESRDMLSLGIGVQRHAFLHISEMLTCLLV